jgi:hypothetical protein
LKSWGRVGVAMSKNKLGIAPRPIELEAALRESEQRLRWLRLAAVICNTLFAGG